MSSIQFRVVGTFFGSPSCPISVFMENPEPTIADVMVQIAKLSTTGSFKKVTEFKFDEDNKRLQSITAVYNKPPTEGKEIGEYVISTSASGLPTAIIQRLHYYVETADGRERTYPCGTSYRDATVMNMDKIYFRAISIRMAPLNLSNVFQAAVVPLTNPGPDPIRVRLSVIGIYFGTPEADSKGVQVLLPANTNKAGDVLENAASQYGQSHGFHFNYASQMHPGLVATIGANYNGSPIKNKKSGMYSLSQQLNTAPQYVWQYYVYDVDGFRKTFGRIPAKNPLPFVFKNGDRIVWRLVTINETPTAGVVPRTKRYQFESRDV